MARVVFRGPIIGICIGLRISISFKEFRCKRHQNARWGVLLGGFLKLIPLFIMVIPGAMAISIYSGIENPDMVYPTIVLNALPKGLIGLVLAGLISAIMSSVDSTLNSSFVLIYKAKNLKYFFK